MRSTGCTESVQKYLKKNIIHCIIFCSKTIRMKYNVPKISLLISSNFPSYELLLFALFNPTLYFLISHSQLYLLSIRNCTWIYNLSTFRPFWLSCLLSRKNHAVFFRAQVIRILIPFLKKRAVYVV